MPSGLRIEATVGVRRVRCEARAAPKGPRLDHVRHEAHNARLGQSSGVPPEPRSTRLRSSRALRGRESLLNKMRQRWINTHVMERANEADLEALYRLRYRHFLRVALLISPDEQRAHDAAQDGCAAAIR